MPQLITDWLCIATSGNTADDRVIEPQWLYDAAETYARETYTAMIWPHHPCGDISERNYTCNLGEVESLKVEAAGDAVKLYARLVPNQFLLEANRMGQKLFTSTELWADFAGSGKYYLAGLAVTDIPASLGTEKITFNFEGEQYSGMRGSVENFSLGKLKNNRSSVWGRLFSARKQFAADPENKQPAGEEAKMDELRELIEKMLARLDTLEAAAAGETDAETPVEAAAEVGDLADEIADAADEVAEIAAEVAKKPEDEVIAAEFTAAQARMSALIKKFSTGSEKPRRRRSRRGQFSAGKVDKKAGSELLSIRADMNKILEKFNVMNGQATRLPGKGPADSKKPFEYL